MNEQNQFLGTINQQSFRLQEQETQQQYIVALKELYEKLQVEHETIYDKIDILEFHNASEQE